MSVTRLAPSPTGALHLGNARTFVITWAIARQRGWTLLMRMEDLDGPRVKPAAATAALEILAWLGLDHDGPVRVQSESLERYRTAMEELAQRGAVYPCALSRREVEAAASAPHEGHDVVFPASLRPTHAGAGSRFDEERTNYRFLVAPGVTEYHDEVMGARRDVLTDSIGDFVVWTRGGTPAYQLAVVVDDADQAVTDVIRGDDLLPSTARQIALHRALGHVPPRWWHVPLVRGEDGRRLAKRHGDTRVETYRGAGVAAERILGLLGWWCGVTDRREPMTAADFRGGFDVARLSRDSITFTEDDHAWLVAG